MKNTLIILTLLFSLSASAQLSKPQVWYFRHSNTQGKKPVTGDFPKLSTYAYNTQDSILWAYENGVIREKYTFYPYAPGYKRVHKVNVTSEGRYNAPFYQNSVKTTSNRNFTILKSHFTSANTLIINWGDSTAKQVIRGVVTKTWRIYPYDTTNTAPPTLITRIYVSLSGNDSSSNPHDPATPYKTISKINSILTSLNDNDSILFKGGETFEGRLIISKSNLYFGSYGNGKAIITALKTVTGWVHTGGNVWESSATNCKTTLSMVTVNGVMKAKGRYPNANATNGGYLTFESYAGTVSITDTQLSGTPDWDGATLVMRVNKWTIQTKPITNHTGTSITYSGGSTTPQYTSGLGYFIEDDIKTLDSPGEWFLDKTTKKLSVYSISNPGTSVKASIYDTLVKCSNQGYITITNLRFEGANLATMYITDSPGMQILNCEIDGSGGRGIWAFTNVNFKAEGNLINHCNSNALYISNINASIKNNTIKNIGLLPGMATQGTYHAIHLAATPTGTIIQYNSLDSLGSNGMFIMGNNVTVKNNLINHFGLTTDDCGGIYAAGTSYTGKVIEGNIILNAWGNTNGLPASVPAAEGIYIDEPSTGNYVVRNVIANGRASGIKYHNSYSMTCRGNVLYNNAVGILVYKSQSNGAYMRNISFKENVIVAKDASQITLKIYSLVADDPLLFGSSDSNYYCRPVSEGNTIQTRNVNTVIDYSLTSWKGTGNDAHSYSSPLTLTNEADIRFEYNASATNKTVNFLGLKYIDAKGNAHINSIVIQPYTSSVLMRDVSF